MSRERIETTVKFEFDKEKFSMFISTEQFGARRAQKLLTKVVRIASKYAGSIGEVDIKNQENHIDQETDTKIDLEKIGLALYNNIEHEEIEELLLELFELTEVKFNTGKKGGESRLYGLDNEDQYDEAFAGRLTLQFDVLKNVFKANFNDFLSRWRLSKAAKKVEAFVKNKLPKELSSTRELAK